MRRCGEIIIKLRSTQSPPALSRPAVPAARPTSQLQSHRKEHRELDTTEELLIAVCYLQLCRSAVQLGGDEVWLPLRLTAGRSCKLFTSAICINLHVWLLITGLPWREQQIVFPSAGLMKTFHLNIYCDECCYGQINIITALPVLARSGLMQF